MKELVIRSLEQEQASLDSLRASQIVCLEYAKQRLYAEIIQIVRDRQSGWLRPLCFCTLSSSPTPQDNKNSLALAPDNKVYRLHDMRQSADLIWPLSQCRAVLDTEAIPILATLPSQPDASGDMSTMRAELNAFVRNLWGALSS